MYQLILVNDLPLDIGAEVTYHFGNAMEKDMSDNHYIDKQEFTEEMHEHAEDCRAALAAKKPLPRCPESIGQKFYLIAKNVSKKGNFYNYPFKDEMICDALENMVRYRYNYDKAKGAAFSYFTQYAIYAFISRIKLEKKELTKKAKWVQKIAVHEVIPHVLNDQDVSQDFKNDYVNWLIEYYDEKLDDEDKKKKKGKKSIEAEPDEPRKPGPLGI